MATYIEEFVAKLGFEIDGAALTQFDKKTARLKKTLGTIGKVASIATGALTGVVAIANSGTARVDALASSVGFTTTNLMALTNAIKPLGFEVDNVVDLVEEMNNKIGESTGLKEATTPVQESLKILGLEYKKIKDLAPEKQFNAIVDSALKLGDAQQAASAVDILVGGEANKIIGFLRTQKKTLSEIIAEQKKLNFLTEDGIAGAKRMNGAVSKLGTVTTSLFAESSGKLGEVLGPFLEQLLDWVVLNKELIQTELDIWVRDVGDFLLFMFDAIKNIISVLGFLVEKVGGLRNAFKILLGILIAIVAVQIAQWIAVTVVALKSLVVALGGVKAILIMLKTASLFFLKWGLLILVVILLLEDLWGFFTGKESVIGDLSDEFLRLINVVSDFWAEVMGIDKAKFKTDVIGFLSQEWQQFFVLAAQWWGDFFKSTFSSVVGWIDSIRMIFVDYGVSIFQSWGPEFLKFSEFFIVELEGMGNAILGFFTGIGEGIKAILDDAVNFVADGIADVVDILPESTRDFLGISPSGGKPSGNGTKPKRAGAGLSPRLSNPSGKSVLGLTKSAKRAPAVGGNTYHINVPTNLAVNQSGKMNPEELKRHVSKAIGTEVSRAVRNNSGGVAN